MGSYLSFKEWALKKYGIHYPHNLKSGVYNELQREYTSYIKSKEKKQERGIAVGFDINILKKYLHKIHSWDLQGNVLLIQLKREYVFRNGEHYKDGKPEDVLYSLAHAEKTGYAIQKEIERKESEERAKKKAKGWTKNDLLELLKEEGRESELQDSTLSQYIGTKGKVLMNVIEFDGMPDCLLVTRKYGIIKTQIQWNPTTEESVIRHKFFGTVKL